MQQQRNQPGVRQRHRRDCTRRGRCACSWQAEIFDPEAGEKIRRTFPTRAAAKSWRQDAIVALKQGRIRATTALTLNEAAEAWLEGARDGTIRNRAGDIYQPSAIRSYEASLRLRVLRELGSKRLSDLRRTHVQDLVSQLVADGLAAATIQATIIPLKAICRREVNRGRMHVNPTIGVELPAVRGGRERIADPVEAARLLAALPEKDCAVWATAMYAGLRRGELMALRASDIDIADGVIHVRRGWDMKEGPIETKGRKPRRVPIASVLREPLLAHLMRTGRRDEALVFGATDRTPFYPNTLTARADAAWKAAGLRRIKLHECRHTFASLLIAAGVNAKALSTYVGHADIATTFNKYGHLMPGNEDQAVGLLDAYLTAATGAAQ
jgi:integrase